MLFSGAPRARTVLTLCAGIALGVAIQSLVRYDAPSVALLPLQPMSPSTSSDRAAPQENPRPFGPAVAAMTAAPTVPTATVSSPDQASPPANHLRQTPTPTTQPGQGAAKAETAAVNGTDAQYVFLGKGPCRDRKGSEPQRYECQANQASQTWRSTVEHSKETCKRACRGPNCSGWMVCDIAACLGLCIVYVLGKSDEVRIPEGPCLRRAFPETRHVWAGVGDGV